MRYAMITGAHKGTGYAIAQRFAREGWGVIVTSRSGENARAAAESIARESGGYARGFACAAGNENQVVEIFEALRRENRLISALVLNAADLGMGQNAFTVPLDQWMQVIGTNLGWNFSIMRQAALHMKDRGGGAIAIIGSNTTRRAIPDRSAYIASKGGLVALSKALAVEWGDYRIRVNVVVSGSIKTERWANQTEAWRQIRRDRAPLGDIADFDDLANAAYFLCSDEAGIITGAELCVDGGVDAQFLPKMAR